MLWLTAYLMGLPPTGLYTLCWMHGQTPPDTGNSWKKIASVNSTSYTDKKLEKGTLYKYKIRAYKNVNGKKQYSEYSPQKSVKR